MESLGQMAHILISLTRIYQLCSDWEGQEIRVNECSVLLNLPHCSVYSLLIIVLIQDGSVVNFNSWQKHKPGVD